MKISLSYGDLVYRIASDNGGKYILQQSNAHYELHTPPYGREPISATRVDASELDFATVLPPTEPRCIFGVGENYDAWGARPLKDRIFTKTLNTLAGHGSCLHLPQDARRTVFEGELVAVLGQRLTNANPSDAEEAILGYTIGNDFSEDGWFQEDRQWWRVKGVDGFSPVGPAIHIGFPGGDARIVTTVNGRIRQDAPLSRMRTSPGALLSEISRYVTLLPGDLIFLGTPSGAGTVEPGDTVDVTIGSLGTLKTHICCYKDKNDGSSSSD